MADYDRRLVSPILAICWWAKDGRHYACYYVDDGTGAVATNPKAGRKTWGQAQRLWSTDVEPALNRELETPVARDYQQTIRGGPPSGRERVKWARRSWPQPAACPIEGCASLEPLGS